MTNLETILLEISKSLNLPWWQHYEFYIGIFNIVVLAATLYFLVKSTQATQVSAEASRISAEASKKMAKEMLIQRLMQDAQDVNFRMEGNYIINNPQSQHFGILTTIENNNNISLFSFLNSGSLGIGNATPFKKVKESDNYLQSNYRMEENGFRRSFIETLQKRRGIIKAKVQSTNGTEFIYTYKAYTDNWQKNELYPPELKEHQFKPVSDDFTLVSKTVDPDFLKKFE